MYKNISNHYHAIKLRYQVKIPFQSKQPLNLVCQASVFAKPVSGIFSSPEISPSTLATLLCLRSK